MIVADTSAIVAILLGEPDRARCVLTLTVTTSITISALTLFEAHVVLRGKGFADPEAELRGLFAGSILSVAPFDLDQSLRAFEADRRFGKGSGSPARLDLADCAA